MELDYKKTYTIELLNEYSASVYNRVLNYVLNNDIDKNDVTNKVSISLPTSHNKKNPKYIY